MNVSNNDKKILRELAEQIKELALSPRNIELKRRWANLNDLNADAPMVIVSPEGAWDEIQATFELKCTDDKLREFELQMRTLIYHQVEIKDDTTIDAAFDIMWKVTRGDYGVDIIAEHTEGTGSYKYDHPLTDLDKDIDKLHFRQNSVDREGTKAEVELAESIFGDILEVRLKGGHWWTCGLTWECIKLVGLENLMLLMFDNPDGLKRLMQFLSDEMMHFIEWFEKEGLLSYNNGANIIGSGNIGHTNQLPSFENPRDGSVTLKDSWGFAESQETVGVSPEMFAEFVLPYQLPLMEKFGLNYYGCCEPIDNRFEYIKQIPNLRCVSVSAWADPKKCAELLGKDYVYCFKPSPTPVSTEFDEETIRKNLRNTLDVAGDLNLMMVMKDTVTICNELWRLNRWVEIAREEIARVS